jgi:hypothetical protein
MNPEINYFDPNVLKAEADLLLKLQERKNGGLGVSCVKTIAAYLQLERFDTARQVRQLEGDKTRQYEDIENELRRFFGCRIHGKHDCQDWICQTKTYYPPMPKR